MSVPSLEMAEQQLAGLAQIDGRDAEIERLRARVAELQAENDGLTVERDYYRALATQRNG